MKVKIVVEYIADYMPDIQECEDICMEEGVIKKGNEAVVHVVSNLLEDESVIGIADQNRILQIIPIETSNFF